MRNCGSITSSCLGQTEASPAKENEMLRLIALCVTAAAILAAAANASTTGGLPPERCQSVSDTIWYKEFATHRTTLHEIVKLDLCFIPGGWFTQIKPDSVSVLNLTCGTHCTYPYVTSVESPPAMQTTYRGARASIATQFKVEVCPLLIGPACTFSTYFTLTTHYCINGAGQGRRPDKGTATLYIWKCGSDYRKGV
jgi:hypothetical protein